MRFVEPGEGYLACGWIGKGRLAEPDEIVAAAERGPAAGGAAARPARARHRRARPTKTSIRSATSATGRAAGWAFAIAAEAARRGARRDARRRSDRVEPPAGVEVVRVRSAAEMHAAVMRRAGDADVVVMAAAVADYTPARARPAEGREGATTADADARSGRRTSSPSSGAARRRRRRAAAGRLRGRDRGRRRARAAEARAKHVDLIVANDVSRADAGFDVDTNAVTSSAPTARRRCRCSKAARRRAILDRVEQLLAARVATVRA